MSGTVQGRIEEIFVRHLHIQPPQPDLDLIDRGAIDSVTFVELIANLEQEFSIRIPLDDLDLNHFRSIASIDEFVRTQLPETEVPIGSHSRV
jgi:acyl carrier protein